MNRICFFLPIFIFACNNKLKKEQLITGVYLNDQDSFKQQIVFKSDTSLVFDISGLKLDPNIATTNLNDCCDYYNTDCNYYIKEDTIFISSLEHSFQSHIMHLEIFDTLLIDKRKNLIDLSTNELYIKQSHIVMEE